VKLLIRIRRWIVWRVMIPLARRIDADRDDGDESFINRAKDHLRDIERDERKG